MVVFMLFLEEKNMAPTQMKKGGMNYFISIRYPSNFWRDFTDVRENVKNNISNWNEVYIL